jgi:phage FluMu protein gp41
MKADYAWQELYEAAILETNVEKMQPRVLEAKAAIDARLHELQLDHQGTPEERLALSDALAGLNLLRKEIETRAHDTGSSKA